MYIIRFEIEYGLYTRELIMRQGPISQKSRNILGLFWVSQFPLSLLRRGPWPSNLTILLVFLH